MKLCVPIPCFFGNSSFPEAIKTISRLGYTAAETYDYSSLDRKEVKAVCEEYGVSLISMCTSEFRMTDASYRDAWLQGLKLSLDAAHQMGASKLITQVGQDTGDERARQHEAIVKTLTLARPLLEEYGVTVMIEPLNTLVDHPGYYLTHASEAFDIVREVASPFVKVVYDIYHQQISEGNIIPSVTNNLEHIAHLHGAGHPGRIEMWMGESDYKVIFDAIDKAGYTGFCGLEYHPTLDASESLRRAREIYG